MGLKRFFLSLAVWLSRLLASLSSGTKLHRAKFANLHEMTGLLCASPEGTALLLGVSHLSQTLCVRPAQARRELGNLLVVAPTRGGKGLLAVSQLLSWPHSVVVNDIKGELFSQTAGYRNTQGQRMKSRSSWVRNAFAL